MVNSVTSRTRVGSHRGRRFSCTRAENVEPRPSCSVDKSNEPHQTRHQLRDQRTSRSFGIAARPLLVAVSDCEWFCVAAKMYLVGQRPCSACGCAQRLCCQLTSHTLVPLESGRGGFCFICFLLVMCESMYVCMYVCMYVYWVSTPYSFRSDVRAPRASYVRLHRLPFVVIGQGKALTFQLGIGLGHKKVSRPQIISDS